MSNRNPHAIRNPMRPNRRGQRGSGAHELVDQANAWYRAQGLALIERVEPPLFGRRQVEGLAAGEVAGRVRRSTVDYRGGVWVDGLGAAVAVAFDLKATAHRSYLDIDPGHASQAEVVAALQTGSRIRARAKVPPHQVHWLTDAERCGVIAFWLVQFTSIGRHYVLPHAVLRRHYAAPWRIPLAVVEAEGIAVAPRGLCVLDYLAAVPQLRELARGRGRQDRLGV